VKGVLGDDEIPDIPLLILANKTDKQICAGEEEIRQFFGLYSLTTGKVSSPCVMLQLVMFYSHSNVACTLCRKKG